MTLTPDTILIVLVTAGGFAFLVVILLFVVARAAGRSAHATAPLTSQMEYLNQTFQNWCVMGLKHGFG